MTTETTVHRLLDKARQTPAAAAYHVKERGAWQPTSYAEYAALVRRAARGLIALGVTPGVTVSILGYNRPEWVITDVAAMAAGGAPVGIYTTCSADEVRYIVDHAESRVVLLENEEQWKKVAQEQARLPHLRHVVMMKGAPKIAHPLVIGWEEFLAKGDAVDDARLDERVAALEPQALATLIYTSGTTGPPKGVMLSHENLAWTADVSMELIDGSPADRTLSYLPLSHIAEQMFSIHGPIRMGSSIYFAQRMETVPDDLKEVQPTVFFGVPRIWEKFHGAISGKLGQARGAKRAIAGFAMKVGAATTAARNAGQKPGPLLALQHRIADKLVFRKLKPAIGLGAARICVSGAAPISPEVLEFFAQLDIPVLEVYGQSEDTGPTSFNVPGRTRYGTVGPVVPGVEVRIAADGEILVRGKNVFLGYYKEPQATAETLVDGWLHSGDLGEIDADGFLTITGRKKDILITAGGKNITPKNIESSLKNHPLVSEAVVVGDRRKFLTALITLDPDATARFCEEHAIDKAGAHTSREVTAAIQGAVDAVNATLARVETIKKFTVLARGLTIEDGELTPTLKVKRKAVNESFSREIEAMYAEADA